MRAEVNRERLLELTRALAASAPRRGRFRLFLVGGGTAVFEKWRPSSIDADLCSDREELFRDIQAIKERLQINVEFVRPEHFVPPLEGSEDRHIFLESVGNVDLFHYDPYSQILAKIVRGFARDLDDAGNFVKSGMVKPGTLRELVRAIPNAAYAKYPRLSAQAVNGAVDSFLRGFGSSSLG